MGSCICSFMSTADSICLATGNQFTLDFWVNGFWKGNASQQSTLIFTKECSLTIICTGVCIALYTDVGFFDLLDISFLFLNTYAPAYWGMWWDVHAFPVSCGSFLGTCIGVAIKIDQMTRIKAGT